MANCSTYVRSVEVQAIVVGIASTVASFEEKLDGFGLASNHNPLE